MARFSIILPTFRRNQSGLLRRAMQSVLGQTHRDFELFVVDDGSTDGSADTIHEFALQDGRVKHLRFEQNVGLPAITCARALLESSGEFIAWMFDDCEWDSNYLQEMNDLLSENPEAGVAYAQCEAHFTNGSRIVGKPLDTDDLLHGNNHVPNGATIVRRSAFYQIGWYDPRIVLVRNNDWDFLRRAVLAGIKFVHLPKVLTHEYGVALRDSLGNTYDTNFDLVNVFVTSDRRDELQPDRIASFDVISLPLGVHLSNEHLLTYLRILLDFAIKTGRESLFQRISNSELFSTLGVPLRKKDEQIKWWAAATSERWRKEIHDKDVYIQGQLKYIDDQIKYINEQHIYIEKKHSEIRERDALLQQQAATILFLQSKRAYILQKLAALGRRVYRMIFVQ